MKRFVAASAAAALLAAAGCRQSIDRRPPRARVRVAAAADLNAAMGDLVARFSGSHAVDVEASYGSSGTFYAQLLNDASEIGFKDTDARDEHGMLGPDVIGGLTLELPVLKPNVVVPVIELFLK